MSNNIDSLLRKCRIRLNKLVNMEMSARNETEKSLINDVQRYWLDEETRLLKKQAWLASDNPKKTIDLDIIKEQVKVKDYLKMIGCKVEPTSQNRSRCKCIFHKEKTPSLVIYEETNSFYCFGCLEDGSIIDLVMKHENLTLSQTIKKLSSLL